MHRSKNALLKYIFFLALFLASFSESFSQALEQSNFAGILVPQYMSATTSNRLPVMFRAKLSGLNANSTYRYYVQSTTNDTANGAKMDFGGVFSGAGTSIMINSAGTDFTITTSPGLSTLGKYETFTTDATGSYIGWFGITNTGDARFTAGNKIYPTITLNNGNDGSTPAFRFALDMSINVLALGTTSAANYGTGIWGNSAAAAKNMVALYDNINGTGRPLAITYVESEGITSTSAPSFYNTNVNGKDGKWGALIPNINTNGVRKIEQFSVATGSSLACATDADGIWPTGNVKTANPIKGTTALKIDSTDAPLIMLSGSSVSNLSDIYPTPGFSYPQNILYKNYTEAADISLSNTSLQVASFDLRDGHGTTDADNLPTLLSSVSFDILNADFINRVALYDGNTELAETTPSGNTLIFNSLSLQADDNGSKTFSIRVSFKNTVTDNAQLQFIVKNAVADNSGSGFYADNAGGSFTSISEDNNRIEVLANKLVLDAGISTSATIYTSLNSAPVVYALDENDNTDLDFEEEITLSNTSALAAKNNVQTAISGKADFPLFLFETAGTTKLIANATTLQSDTQTQSILVADAVKWTGNAGTNLWADAANWSNNISPDSGSVVLLDNSFINSGYNVILPDFYVKVNHLKIAPSANKSINLTLPSTNFSCPGFGIGDENSGTTDFEVENGGIFINAAACASGQGLIINALGNNEAVKIASGGTYIHRNAKSHIEILDAASWEKDATLIFDASSSTAYAISLPNRILGNVTLSAETKGTTQAYSSNFASTAIVKGKVIIESKATLSLSGNGNLEVGGNIENYGTFKSGNTNRKVVMNGNQAQAFSGTGIYEIKALEINNTQGITLLAPISLNNKTGAALILTNGNLFTSAANLLTLPELATVSGGSKSSFIAGPVSKIFDTTSQKSIVLPLGKDTFYRPVTISPNSLATISSFSAEYFDNQDFDASKYSGDFSSVSNTEYWNIVRTSGISDAKIGLQWGENSNISSINTLQMAYWNGSSWEKNDATSITGNAATGTVTSTSLSQFGAFTLGTAYIAPLPVTWLYFSAKAKKNDVILDWATASELNNNGFEIERSADGENWQNIGWINGNGTSNTKHFYSYTDIGATNLLQENIYYRIRQIDFNGAYEYSNVETIRRKNTDLAAVSIYATPEKCLQLQISSEINTSAEVFVLNMKGQVLYQSISNLAAGSNQLYIPMQKNTSGIYILKIVQNGTIHTQKFVLL